jgi:hypothetical protein
MKEPCIFQRRSQHDGFFRIPSCNHGRSG